MIKILLSITLLSLFLFIFTIKSKRNNIMITSNTFIVLFLVLILISTSHTNYLHKTPNTILEKDVLVTEAINNDSNLDASSEPTTSILYHNIDDNKLHKIRQMIDISEGSSELNKSIAIEYIVYLPEPVIDCILEKNLKIYITPNAKESCLKLTGFDFGTMDISGVFNYDEYTGESIICVNENEIWWSLYHEIGHAFDCFNGYEGKYKTSTDDTFETIFHKEKEEVIRDTYMYDYIADNKLEYFAEAFRYYCENIYNSYKYSIETPPLPGKTYEYISNMINSQ